MAISITFTTSLSVSMLKKTIIFHLIILNVLSEKKKSVCSAEDNPESAEIAQYKFRDQKKKSTNLETNRVFY